EGGFQPGLIYELIYRTRICPVVGAGFLSVRDCVSFLRHATEGNPVAGRIDHCFGYGQSQTGRFLRHFLSCAMNVDEEGRRVFDGVMPHVAGARRGEFNHRYAQPSAQHALSFGHLPPFHDLPQRDPLTGEGYPGLLDAQKHAGSVPKVFHTNTSSEYWRSEASLCHSDTGATRDVDPGADSRVYLLAGTEHGAGAVPPPAADPKGARTANPRNTVNYAPPLRALFLALEEWVVRGVEPPPSAIPRLADGSAAARQALLERFSRVPGAALIDPDELPALRRVDLGPRAAEGIATLPPRAGERYPCFVAAVDDDFNEVAGIRLPDLTVPLGSHTGWNPRHPEICGGNERALGQNVDMYGSTLPFPRTRAERERRRDPRVSIEERYASRDDYLAQVRSAARDLMRQRFLVEEDVDLVLKHAAERYDYFTSA
ncbi:MAG TPA: alpha/beta hydrolase domain-containing protein, partial [Chloroflexota bacterium]|nr:alpha/beta hydrolase domain-containing protein [Chloroflexota bacterium]